MVERNTIVFCKVMVIWKGPMSLLKVPRLGSQNNSNKFRVIL